VVRRLRERSKGKRGEEEGLPEEWFHVAINVEEWALDYNPTR
jgi:hypothetical protein